MTTKPCAGEPPLDPTPGELLQRVSQQLAEVAARLDNLVGSTAETSASGTCEESVFNFLSGDAQQTAANDAERRLLRITKPPLPDPRLVRQIIRQRQLRARFFDGELFADPAWDMLLDLAAARAEHKRVSVTSLCIASGVPPTTALRWIQQMAEGGLLERVEDEIDRRRAFITLSDRAAKAIARLFAALGNTAERMV